MSEKNEKGLISEPIFIVALVITVLVLVVFIVALMLPVDGELQDYPTKWNYLDKGTPNELGDTLAGIAGSLAFVWLVATVLLQSKELRLQRIEFSQMAKAQNVQVDLLKTQGEIFKQEQKERREDRSFGEISELLEALINQLFIPKGLIIFYSYTDGSLSNPHGVVHALTMQELEKNTENLELKEILKFADIELWHLLEKLSNGVSNGTITSGSGLKNVERVLKFHTLILKKVDLLSEERKQWLLNAKFYSIGSSLEDIAEHEIWELPK